MNNLFITALLSSTIAVSCNDCFCIDDNTIRCPSESNPTSVVDLPCRYSAMELISASNFLCNVDIVSYLPQLQHVAVIGGTKCQCLCGKVNVDGCTCLTPASPTIPAPSSSNLGLKLGFGIGVPAILVVLFGLAVWNRNKIMHCFRPGHVVGHRDVEMRLANLEVNAARQPADLNIQLNRANAEQFQDYMGQLAQLEVHSNNTLAACTDLLNRLEPNFQPINRDIQIGILDPTWQLVEDNFTRFLRSNLDKPTLRTICETSHLEFLNKSWNELAANLLADIRRTQQLNQLSRILPKSYFVCRSL